MIKTITILLLIDDQDDPDPPTHLQGDGLPGESLHEDLHDDWELLESAIHQAQVNLMTGKSYDKSYDSDVTFFSRTINQPAKSHDKSSWAG